MKKCSGEGQGSCKKCEEKGIWNRMWMCFLYTVEGQEGTYCYECAKELENKISECEGNDEH